jgi:hypothetical protein
MKEVLLNFLSVEKEEYTFKQSKIVGFMTLKGELPKV